MPGEMLTCYNKGCGKDYNPEENTAESCKHHPGVPVFHDALKGWSCCKKRSTDFTEFLKIPGCTTNLHSNVKPVEPEKPKLSKEEEELAELIATPKNQPIKPEEPQLRPSEGEPMVRIPATVGATLKQALEKQMDELKLKDAPLSEDTTVAKIGESCKNGACKGTYQGEESNLEICLHHPGCPIFHEGMKYWSCCQRKTSDFDNFLNQEGCTEGKHVWIKEKTGEKKVDCRYDWHQTVKFVTLSVFAKVAIPDKTWVEVNQVCCKVNIAFDRGDSVFEKLFILRGVIDPAQSSVKLLGSKVEINLRKAEAGSWSTLEFPAASHVYVVKDDEMVEVDHD